MMKKILFPIVLLTLFNFSLQAQTNMMAAANANPGFELFDSVANTVTSWSRSNGGIATLTSVTTNVQSGLRCFEANVTGTPTSQSNVQISNNKTTTSGGNGYYALTAGTSYTLRYWAKADSAGRKINALMQTSTFATPTVISGNMYGVTLTAAWKQYTVVFSTATANNYRPAFQFGYSAGVYHLDNIELFETNATPVEFIASQANSQNIVPNPTTGFIQVKNTEGVESLEIFDLTGRLVRQFLNNNNPNFDISDLPNGMYQCVIKSKETPNIRTVSKIMKM